MTEPYDHEPEYDKYAGLEMVYHCDKCNVSFMADEPDTYCPCHGGPSPENKVTQDENVDDVPF